MALHPPPNAPLPPAYTPCIVEASAYYSVPPTAVAALLMVEGGKPGSVHHNHNGTVDLGPMQINSIHLRDFAHYGINGAALANQTCVNIAAGTWLLSQHLRATHGHPWQALGDYHSKTPRFHQRYLRRAKHAYIRLLGHFTDYAAYLRVATARAARRLAQRTRRQH